MRISYFRDADTLYIDFRAADAGETCEPDENTTLDVDNEGNLCALTVEHASDRSHMRHFSFEQLAA